jgi:hypothetical protein
LNGISKWIRASQENHEQFFDDDGTINLHVFTAAHFEQFLLSRLNNQEKETKVGTLNGFRSAIKDLYRRKKMVVPNAYLEDMKTFFSGLKRINADNVQSGYVKNSGKIPLSYSDYAGLCRATLALDDGGFAHLFLTTQWNLMCRSRSVETLDVRHLTSRDDSIGCILFKTKTDQEGRAPKDPRHIYANPFTPETCWITALAVYLACNPTQSAGPLFPGANQKNRFGKILQRILKKENEAHSEYGTHSVRKGVGTFACSGSTGGPSIVSVCLRCGWSLGGVQDRYFRYESAGDQFLGRVVAGLPLNKSDFAVLPPHFIDKNDHLASKYVNLMFPVLRQEVHLRPVLHMCLASLAYNSEYLVRTLRQNHPLLSTLIFCNERAMSQLQGRVIIEDSQWMRATGIPPHVELYRQHNQTITAIEALPDVLTERMSQLIEEKGVTAGNITPQMLREMCDEIIAHTRTPIPNTKVSNTEKKSTQVYCWKEKHRLLPEDFKFPSIDVQGAWMLWLFGNSRLGFPPLKRISTTDLSTRTKRQTYSEWSILMQRIEAGIMDKTGSVLPKNLTEEHALELFRIGVEILPKPPSQHKRRWSQLKVSTVVRLIREHDQAGNPNRRRLQFKKRKRRRNTSVNKISQSTLSHI